jgi:HAD superfamily hydrolase (TIGR01549 family)
MTMPARPSRPLPAAVLFDFDGTLADSEPLITASLIHALGTEGFTVTAAEVRNIFGAPLEQMVPLLTGPLSPTQGERIRVAYFAHFNEQLPRIQPVPGAVALLDALAARAIPLAIVTNKVQASAARQLAVLGWASRFAVVVGADSTPRPKPAPDPALLALQRLDVGARTVAYVGDQVPDMACAAAAGIPMVIGLAFSRAPETLAAAGATYVARSLEEVEAVLLRGDTICA